MTNTNSSTYSPAAAWNTLLQPFYVLSTVIGILIGTSILALALRGCARRRAARRRFVRAVDGGWAVPIFNVSEDINANIAVKNANGPKPIMRESVLDLNGGLHVDGGLWAKALPLSVTLLPTPASRPHDLLLYLLRSPSILTSNLFSRLRAIQFVRSNQTQYHHRFLTPSGNHRTPEPQSVSHRTSISSTKSEERPPEVILTEPVQVMFVIAMPVSPPLLHPGISPATAHEPAIPIANQELCIGIVAASLQVPVQYLKGPREEQAAAIRHGNMQEVVEEEDEANYASTVYSRRMRSEDPGHEYARSPVSSRHMYVGNYGDEESSYMPHRTASSSPSYWEDHGGATGGGGGGSTHDTHNSYLAPPSFGYRPSAQGHGRDNFSLIEIQQPQARNDQGRSGDSSDYPPSRAYTPSFLSANVPPPPDASAPPASSTSPPLPTQPRVLIRDTEPTLAATGDIASHQSHGSAVEHPGLAVNRVSQFTSTTDTTASATDVEGGYDADADASRRLSLKPRSAARRRAGS